MCAESVNIVLAKAAYARDMRLKLACLGKGISEPEVNVILERKGNSGRMTCLEVTKDNGLFNVYWCQDPFAEQDGLAGELQNCSL